MRRADRLVCLAALGLGGCMRIYPDPELPDVDVEWFAEDCEPGTDQVALSLIGVDDPEFRSDVVLPCADEKTTFADLARERFRIDGTLVDAGGGTISMSQAEVDLRNGLDARASMYFAGVPNFRVAWTFEMGASCGSVGADFMLIYLRSPDLGDIGTGASCALSPYLGSVTAGVYTVQLRAVAADATLAVSPEVSNVVIETGTLTDLGTLVMTPCGSSCP